MAVRRLLTQRKLRLTPRLQLLTLPPPLVLACGQTTEAVAIPAMTTLMQPLLLQMRLLLRQMRALPPLMRPMPPLIQRRKPQMNPKQGGTPRA